MRNRSRGGIEKCHIFENRDIRFLIIIANISHMSAMSHLTGAGITASPAFGREAAARRYDIARKNRLLITAASSMRISTREKPAIAKLVTVRDDDISVVGIVTALSIDTSGVVRYAAMAGAAGIAPRRRK